MFGARSGIWIFKSEKDPRWNYSGRVERLIVTAGICKEAEEKAKQLLSIYHEYPDDLEYGCMKE